MRTLKYSGPTVYSKSLTGRFKFLMQGMYVCVPTKWPCNITGNVSKSAIPEIVKVLKTEGVVIDDCDHDRVFQIFETDYSGYARGNLRKGDKSLLYWQDLPIDEEDVPLFILSDECDDECGDEDEGCNEDEEDDDDECDDDDEDDEDDDEDDEDDDDDDDECDDDDDDDEDDEEDDEEGDEDDEEGCDDDDEGGSETAFEHEDLVCLLSTALFDSAWFEASYDKKIYKTLKVKNGDCFEEMLADMLLAGHKITITDYAADGESYSNRCVGFDGTDANYEVALEDFLKIASTKRGRRLVKEVLSGDGDYYAADSFLQLVVFGEEIYS